MFTYFTDEKKGRFFNFSISLIALAVNFFNFGNLPINAAWVAILLCGIPIVWGEIVGLITEFDIKADVFVTISLIASALLLKWDCFRNRVR
jgi:hypothetical protein